MSPTSNRSVRPRRSIAASARCARQLEEGKPSARSRASTRVALLLGSVTLVSAACAGAGAAPTIEEPWARSNPNGLGAAYLVITMPDDDVLIAVEVDPAVAGRVELHEVIDDEGRMLMRERDGGIPLPGSEAVELRPGGFHIMFLDMPEMLEIGVMLELTLRFAQSDPVTVQAEVREGATEGMPPMTDDTMGTMDLGSAPSSMNSMHGGSSDGS